MMKTNLQPHTRIIIRIRVDKYVTPSSIEEKNLEWKACRRHGDTHG